jgi:hypothetical protein
MHYNINKLAYLGRGIMDEFFVGILKNYGHNKFLGWDDISNNLVSISGDFFLRNISKDSFQIFLNK